jgi:PAS domain S-box-containing protein
MSISINQNTEDAFTNPNGLIVQILNHISDPIFLKNDQLQFLFVNDAFCSLQGKKREELLGKTLPETSCNDRLEYAEDIEKSVLETAKEHIGKHELTEAKGNSLILTAKRIRLTDKEGRQYVFCIMKDASAANPTQTQTLRVTTTKSGMPISREVIHDLNNSLNIVRGYSELLLEDLTPGDPLRKDVEAIYQAGQNAAEIASRL